MDKIHGKGAKDTLRDKVWKALYPKCKDDFKNRLANYNPTIILNGCTSGLKGIVQETVNEVFPVQSIQTFNISHPSGWQSQLGAFKKCEL